MKKVIIAAALILSTSIMTSCKKEAGLKPTAPLHTLAGFKKDISSAD